MKFIFVTGGVVSSLGKGLTAAALGTLLENRGQPLHVAGSLAIDRWQGTERVQLRVHRGAPAPETELAGPAVVELPESTLLVPPGWAGEVDDTGTVHVRAQDDS